MTIDPEQPPETRVSADETLLLASTDPNRGAFGLPERVGRYRVLRILGEGSFGRVYLGQDEILERTVAIKVPRPERVSRPEDVEAFLTEARILTKLESPRIVPVYDAGRTDDGLCYVVWKFIEGNDLAHRIRQGRVANAWAAELVATVAEALHHAHTNGLVHRDVKPANILIDGHDNPYLADFGLALRDVDFGKGAGFAGTPAYMSPEQARGEGHRVDRRSDLFSLGIVFYELLTGRRPFQAETTHALIYQIAMEEPPTPRQVDETIARELERICLKALSKRAIDRYGTGEEMSGDLRHFLHPPQPEPAPESRPSLVANEPIEPPATARARAASVDSDSHPIKIVPKGLRSFDAHDADFFLELLPGPHDRDGLPNSIRFWKTRAEETDAERTFPVGLLYGPSGCGKSSLVKAGLLPRLAATLEPIYLESTADETETRLLKGLRRHCPGLPPEVGLVDALAALRRGTIHPSSRKLLIVLDQFEQWLHARNLDENTELVAALRQCDGERIQAIVMVRDDFWMAATRFMRSLEIRLVEGENSAAVDLFDPLHARKVMTAFGRAYGALPERPGDMTSQQHAFLDQAIRGLAHEGKAVSVRLALFAEMIKNKPWTPVTLKQVGGTEGIGLTFLEETFTSATAPPAHRLHQNAARLVLTALLPEGSDSIKGQMRSYQELLDASGYIDRPADFADLLRILDGELRLITPTEPEAIDADTGSDSSATNRRFFQLSHDYLVHSLREWLTRKQKETQRGRAELRLAERATLWSVRPENRHLPSAREWAVIRLLTPRKRWTPPQAAMMKKAGRVHGARALAIFAIAAVLTWGGVESYGRIKTSSLIDALAASDTPDVPRVIARLAPLRRWADPRLAEILHDTTPDSREHLHASLALLPVDPAQVNYLYQRLLTAAPTELPVIARALEPHKKPLIERLWKIVTQPQAGGEPSFLPASAALALFDPANPRWNQAAPAVADALVAVNPVFLGPWLDSLRPVENILADSLKPIFHDPRRSESERSLATNILADSDLDAPGLVELLKDARPKAFAVFFPLLQAKGTAGVAALEAELAKRASPDADDDARDQVARRQANAAIALIRLKEPAKVWPLLEHSTDPSVRSYVVNGFVPLGVDPRMLITEFDALPRADAPLHGDAILFDPTTSMRRALILSLGTYPANAIPPPQRDACISRLLDDYRNDPDAGIHGASEWTLGQWDQRAKLHRIDAELPSLANRGQRRWYVNPEGQTFTVIEGPIESRMGSPAAERDRGPTEVQYRRRISRRFALATKEVSIEHYQRFLKDNPKLERHDVDRYSPTTNGPVNNLNWFEAVAYCNWLSHREGLDPCYEPNSRGEYAEEMTLRTDFLERPGYRLPTEAEWEYACRAGALTSRFYGQSPDLMGAYAWFLQNANQHTWPCGRLQPNDLGFFDILGNLYEWCQNRHMGHPTETTDANVAEDVISLSPPLHDDPRVVRCGSFNVLPADVRAAYRLGAQPSFRYVGFGFRLARTCP